MLKTMIKVNEGIGASFTETMVMFKEGQGVQMQEFKTKEGAKKHLDKMLNVITESAKNLDFTWELAITYDDIIVIESQEKDATCFLYIEE